MIFSENIFQCPVTVQNQTLVKFGSLEYFNFVAKNKGNFSTSNFYIFIS